MKKKSIPTKAIREAMKAEARVIRSKLLASKREGKYISLPRRTNDPELMRARVAADDAWAQVEWREDMRDEAWRLVASAWSDIWTEQARRDQP